MKGATTFDFPEKIRLVIWDLDEVFWKGTLTEGGYLYSEEAHEIVVSLAERGIMSSICSKNDFETVRSILIDRGIWDYFVFPSIDWSSKGRRIKYIVNASQLRPETVLFIDDNPSNRGEAVSAVPGLNIADEKIIPTILVSVQ